MPEPTLQELQEWVCSYLVAPGTDAEVATAASSAIHRLLAATDDLAASERIGIYREQYRIRLVGALRSDFPDLARFVGDAMFAKLALAYVVEFPSSFFNISRLRDRFPAFLAQRTRTTHGGFVADLARAELAMLEVADAPEASAVRLLALSYPVNLYLRTRGGQPDGPWLTRQSSWLAVYRRDFEIWRQPLDRREYCLLRCLLNGTPLEQGLSMTAPTTSPRENDCAPSTASGGSTVCSPRGPDVGLLRSAPPAGTAPAFVAGTGFCPVCRAPREGNSGPYCSRCGQPLF